MLNCFELLTLTLTVIHCFWIMVLIGWGPILEVSTVDVNTNSIDSQVGH